MATTFQRTGHYTPMWRRVGTCHVYPINEATSEAVCQLTWAYSILDKPNVKFPNGRESHEAANEAIERYEDDLLEYLHVSG